jgi:hypothetical protein
MEQKEGIAENQDGLLEFDITPHEDIGAAALAVGVVEELDPLLLNEEEAQMVMRIKKMALYVTYQALTEIYHANCYATQNH